MNATVTVRRAEDGVWIIEPADAPTVLDEVPGIDVLVLDVLGGHLSWSLLAEQQIPAAVIDDVALAQEWIWAVYGEPIALAIDEFNGSDSELRVHPEQPRLVANAWRLGYAHWAERWWPASTIDGITPLDERLLDKEIAALREECELIVHDDESVLGDLPVSADAQGGRNGFEIPARAEDYALAAGGVSDRAADALVLARGTGGWDWGNCPPGLIDASEHAVSWQLIRTAGATTVRVDAVSAPQLGRDVPTHLRPRARITIGSGDIEAELNLVGDTWTGQATITAEAVSSVQVYVPGLGTPGTGSADARQRIRDLAAARLQRAAAGEGVTFDAPLVAEIAAAASESDF